MSNFKYFYKFCKCYQKQLDNEQFSKQIGLLNNIDELISMIPELLFNEQGTELFWDMLWLDYEFTDEYIDQLWEELKEFQL